MAFVFAWVIKCCMAVDAVEAGVTTTAMSIEFWFLDHISTCYSFIGS